MLLFIFSINCYVINEWKLSSEIAYHSDTYIFQLIWFISFNDEIQVSIYFPLSLKYISFCEKLCGLDRSAKVLYSLFSFAFQTVTHTRAGDYTLIEKHINWYASMDCPIATELNIVWNNEIEPDKAPIKFQKNEWRRPVYFFKTPSNSMDWRYKLSP